MVNSTSPIGKADPPTVSAAKTKRPAKAPPSKSPAPEKTVSRAEPLYEDPAFKKTALEFKTGVTTEDQTPVAASVPIGAPGTKGQEKQPFLGSHPSVSRKKARPVKGAEAAYDLLTEVNSTSIPQGAPAEQQPKRASGSEALEHHIKLAMFPPQEWSNPLNSGKKPSAVDNSFQLTLVTWISRAAKLAPNQGLKLEVLRVHSSQSKKSPPGVTFQVSLPTAAAVSYLLKNQQATTFKKYDCRWFKDTVVDDATTTAFTFKEVDPKHLEGGKELTADIYIRQIVAAGMSLEAIKPGSFKKQSKELDTGVNVFTDKWEFRVYNAYLDNLGSVAEAPVPTTFKGKTFPCPSDPIMCPPQSFLVLDSLNQIHHRSISIAQGCQHCWGPYHNKCVYFKHCKMCLEYIPSLEHKGAKHCCSMEVDGMQKTDMIRIQPTAKPKIVVPLSEEHAQLKTQNQRAIQAKLLRMQERRAAQKQRNQEEKDAREASKSKRAKPTVSGLFLALICFCSLARHKKKTSEETSRRQQQTGEENKTKITAGRIYMIDNKTPITRIKIIKNKKIIKIKIIKYG